MYGYTARTHSMRITRGRSLRTLGAAALILFALFLAGASEAQARDRGHRDRHYRSCDSGITVRFNIDRHRYRDRPSYRYRDYRGSSRHWRARHRHHRYAHRSYRYSPRASLVIRCGSCHRVHSRHFDCRRFDTRRHRSFKRHGYHRHHRHHRRGCR